MSASKHFPSLVNSKHVCLFLNEPLHEPTLLPEILSAIQTFHCFLLTKLACPNIPVRSIFSLTPPTGHWLWPRLMNHSHS